MVTFLNPRGQVLVNIGTTLRMKPTKDGRNEKEVGAPGVGGGGLQGERAKAPSQPDNSMRSNHHDWMRGGVWARRVRRCVQILSSFMYGHRILLLQYEPGIHSTNGI